MAEGKSPRGWLIGLGLSTVVFASLSAVFYVKLVILRLQISFAVDQTAIFDEMRQMSVGSAPQAMQESLDYTRSYYPSGSKQVAGSKLDRIVERPRQNAIREIEAGLQEPQK